ncbi:hypothetical protein IEQ34_014559 [Dendrobium chrysotoxum]|uniref:Uncharacterized protein n=1 Tax=Dendrobium chrysotoxum TaxID=161865 RepID=A0AAV7GL26_DENCH|nr:hypothetical protein IEQ34_014559 [Dendrobium chrysotoxum]
MTAGRAFRSEGGGVANPYGRSFGQRKWTTEEGGWAEPWGSGHVRRREGRWDSHPRYIRKI